MKLVFRDIISLSFNASLNVTNLNIYYTVYKIHTHCILFPHRCAQWHLSEHGSCCSANSERVNIGSLLRNSSKIHTFSWHF